MSPRRYKIHPAELYLAAAAILALALFAGTVIARSWQAGHMRPPLERCHAQLKSLGLAAKFYANESKGELYPSLSTVPGRLMWSSSAWFHEDVDVAMFDPRSHVCPSDSRGWWEILGLQDLMGGDLPPEAWVDDWSYMYIGYLVQDDADVEFLAEEYKKRISRGALVDDLPRPASGNKPNTLFRLREGIERFLITDINDPGASVLAQSSIPVLIEKPGNHKEWGGHVLFLDGHVEWIEGEWPYTTRTLRALREIDALRYTSGN